MLLTLFLLASCSSIDKGEERISPDHKSYNIHGWTVLVGKSLISSNESLLQEGLKEVEYQLFGISRILGEKQLKEFKKVKIWIEENPVDGQPVNAAYHPGKDWLIENGVNPLKVESVEVPGLETFIKWSREANTLILLHELFHAYHHQVLSFDNQEIKSLWKKAVKSGIYENVLYFRGSRKKHYAASNPQEYFAELSEAYLYVNDYYPFNRAELMTFDPEAYKLMKKIWGERK